MRAKDVIDRFADIHIVIEKLVSAGVGQPLNFRPPPPLPTKRRWGPRPASLNFLSLAASAPAKPDENSGRLLGRFPIFNLSVYTRETGDCAQGAG